MLSLEPYCKRQIPLERFVSVSTSPPPNSSLPNSFLSIELCTKHRFKPDEQELKYKYHKSYKVCFIQNWRVLHPPKVGAHAPDEEDLLKYTKRIQFQGTASIKLVCVGSCGSEKTKLLLAYAQRGSISQGDEYIPTGNYSLSAIRARL